MLTRDEGVAWIAAIEKDLVDELEPALAGRVRKLLKAVDQMMASREIAFRPDMVIGWRHENAFLSRDVELIAEGMTNIYKYARPRSLRMVLALLEARSLRVGEFVSAKGAHKSWRQLSTPKGRVVFK